MNSSPLTDTATEAESLLGTEMAKCSSALQRGRGHLGQLEVIKEEEIQGHGHLASLPLLLTTCLGANSIPGRTVETER